MGSKACLQRVWRTSLDNPHLSLIVVHRWTAKMSLLDLATISLICLCQFNRWSSQTPKYLSSCTIFIFWLFIVKVIGIMFILRVNMTASHFIGLKLSSTDKPHLWITSRREFAIVSISFKELLTILRAVSSAKHWMSAEMGRVVVKRSFIKISQRNGDSMPPWGHDRFNCFVISSPLTDIVAWRLHKNEAIKWIYAVGQFSLMRLWRIASCHAESNPGGDTSISGGRGGGLDLASSLEAEFGARFSQVHQIRGKIWGGLLLQDAKIGKESQFSGLLGLYLKFKGQNLGYLPLIFLEAKFRAPTWISEAKFGAKPPRPPYMEVPPLGNQKLLKYKKKWLKGSVLRFKCRFNSADQFWNCHLTWFTLLETELFGANPFIWYCNIY